MLLRITLENSRIAFSPDGNTGWVALLADGVENPALAGYAAERDILLFNTQDQGLTWNGPTVLKGRNFPELVDSLYTELAPGVFTAGIPTFADFALTVDANGHAHLVAHAVNSLAINQPDSLDIVLPYGRNAIVSFAVSPQGNVGFKHLASTRLYNGFVPNTLEMNHQATPGISRDAAGQHIFYTWVEDSNYTAFTQFIETNLYGGALRVADGYRAPVKCFSCADAEFAGRVFYPVMAPVVLGNTQGQDWNVPLVFSEVVINDYNPCIYNYAKRVGFNNVDFVAPSVDAALSLNLVVPNVLCAGVSTQNVAARVYNPGNQPLVNIQVKLSVDGPLDTLLVQTLPGPLAVGDSVWVTFNNVNFSLSGNYILNASVMAPGDGVFLNNFASDTVMAVGGTAASLFPDTVSACGGLLLDPGLAGVSFVWNGIGGGSSNPTFLASQSGTCNLMVSAPGCPPFWDDFEVIIHLLPLNLAASADVCANTPANTVTATQDPTHSVLWEYAVGTPPGALNAPAHSYTGAGYWAAEVSVTDTHGCATTHSIEVKRWDVTPFGTGFNVQAFAFSALQSPIPFTGANELCGGDLLRATHPALLPGTIFLWDVDGDPASQSQDVLLQSGTHNYTLWVQDPIGCGNTSIAITVTRWDPIGLTPQMYTAQVMDTLGFVPAPNTLNPNCALLLNVAEPDRTALNLTPYTHNRWEVYPAAAVDCYSTYGIMIPPPTVLPNGLMVFDNIGPQLVVRFDQPNTWAMARYILESGTCSDTLIRTFQIGSPTPAPGCFSWSDCFLVAPTGTDEAGSGGGELFTVFPNPTEGRATLSRPPSTAASTLTVRVCDATARTVSSLLWPAGAEALEIETRALPPGVYQISVPGLFSTRLVVARD